VGGTIRALATRRGAASYIIRYGVTSDGRSSVRPSSIGVASSDERHLHASTRNHTTALTASMFESTRMAP
jgi:hypothetical protein